MTTKLAKLAVMLATISEAIERVVANFVVDVILSVEAVPKLAH